MADKAQLTLNQRAITGKKVRFLRREGLVPGNLYGRGLDSLAVQAPLDEVRSVFRSVPRNSVVQVQVEGEKEIRPVVLRHVDRNHVSGEVLHVEFYQVDLSRLIQSDALVRLTGDAEAVANGGTLVLTMDTIALEALPLDMPAEIVVDISGLDHFGAAIHVSDLTLPPNVRPLADETAQVATVVAPRLEEEEQEEDLGEGLEGELAEGEEGAEGDPGEEGAVPSSDSSVDGSSE
jgi:large subunit ribosomal protein L25